MTDENTKKPTEKIEHTSEDKEKSFSSLLVEKSEFVDASINEEHATDDNEEYEDNDVSNEKSTEEEIITVLEDTENTTEEDEMLVDNRLLNVEHFSDYKSQKGEDNAIETIENIPSEVAEYENLTILDDEIFDEGDRDNSTEEEESPEEEVPIESDDDDREYDPKKPRKIDGRFELIELFIFTLVAVMILTTFIFRHSVVEGKSMENTLFEGEHLIITDVFYTPKCNDIIVFEDYSTGFKKPIVKRVIATAGQTVQIKIDGVYVDGQRLTEEYAYIDPGQGFNYLEDILPQYINGYTVPEGELFVMGDHRNHSTDSREFGTITEESVLGKVILRFYPFDKFGKVE